MGISFFIKSLSNLPGWRTNRRIIVIESDDWGSIRMPSLEIFERLKKVGLNLESGDSGRYNRNDTLATKSDLAALFDVLTNHKDHLGKHPVITAVSLTSNPDFEKIADQQFYQYYHELFPDTLRKYGNESAIELWKEGIEKHLFIPQFHGREHLNVSAWMRALRRGDKEARLAFEYGLWGFYNQHPHGLTYQAAFDLEFAKDIDTQKEAIRQGLELFQQLHHFKASFFVPPNGPFNNGLEGIAAAGGIKYMSSSKIQREVLGEGKKRVVLHCLGQRNKHLQRYITRNCFFEPNMQGKDWVKSCLRDIEIAFRWKKPAVISSHRVNYIGSLNPKNRDMGLRQLDHLLALIISQWPDVVFLTSNELGDLMERRK